MKLDDGFKESEKLLNQLEKEVHDVYAQATKEMTEKVDNYFAKYKAEDEKQRAKYKQGEITKKEYTEWRQRKMLAGKQYVQMRDTLAKDLTNTDSIAMKMVGDKMIDVYALNMNYETYNIEHETRLDTSFSLYNHDSVERLIKTNPAILPIPKPDKMLDYKWNKQHLQSALTQGILQGESITKIAKRFQNVSGMDERAAIRNARTAMTGAQNGGRLDAMERANENGVEVKKGWMATLDDRTRDSHVELDGEEREIDEEFSNGVMFPGDPEGEPAEVYNCRCRMIHVYPKHPVDWSDLSLRNTDKLGDMTYEEWKEAHGAKKEKEEPEEQPLKTNAEYANDTIDTLRSIYENHRLENGLTSVPADELPDDFFNHANYGNMAPETAKAFNDTIADLSSKYDTTLQEVRLMTKDEYVGNVNNFAFTYHSYETDVSTLVINPAKCGDYEKMTDRIKELVDNNYAVKIDEKLADKYVITHEFAHTLLDMQTPLNSKRNWVGADYDKIKEARKEVEKVYADYLKEKEAIEKEFKKYELDFLNTFSQESADEARKYKEQLDAMTISKYGDVNSDEFMAECFTHKQLGGKDNEYVNKIMEIIDKHFGR